ncbi:TetR family transcriptional regulator [Mesorhizobium sp. Root102]|uniref:TetR/AcrR family transcriptional regulator n=1 Tax=Mesorhizobium sp. Root102 TaxID=1736422 RepID=UPI0006F8D9D5|nr:lytic transglycosylase domain-containing protein [Mesorhizobium sp. Root102]KQU95578.1 TetR family transcriptional regulator [Mesorhizobium sp. Root102]
MGRIKTISDSVVLDRLLAALETAGPDGLSFSKASKAVGLSAATLVQRFATREAMIEAVLLHAWDRLDAVTAAADAEAAISPAGAISMLMRLMPGHGAEYNLTDGLLLLREDLRNPTLRARGSAWGKYLAKSLGRRLTNHTALAERLGWQMASVWQGAFIWWAFKPDGDPDASVATVLEDWCRSVGAK